MTVLLRRALLTPLGLLAVYLFGCSIYFGFLSISEGHGPVTDPGSVGFSLLAVASLIATISVFLISTFVAITRARLLTIWMVQGAVFLTIFLASWPLHFLHD